MDFQQRLKSLIDIVDADIADFYVFDTCQIGIHFLSEPRSPRRFDFDFDKARTGEINRDKLEISYVCSKLFLDFIKKYDQVVAVPTVVKETQEKEEKIKIYTSIYRRNNKLGHKRRFAGKRECFEFTKEARELLEMRNNETDILAELERKVLPMDEHSAEKYRKFVKRASLKDSTSPNWNDEIIIAEAMCYAHARDKRVAIVTSDHMFSSIVLEVQATLEYALDGPRGLKEFLDGGKISVITPFDEEDSYKRFYNVIYCSEDARKYLSQK